MKFFASIFKCLLESAAILLANFSNFFSISFCRQNFLLAEPFSLGKLSAEENNQFCCQFCCCQFLFSLHHFLRTSHLSNGGRPTTKQSQMFWPPPSLVSRLLLF